MAEPSVIHNTFVIERSYPKPVERVFAAFADPAFKRRWYAEGRGHDLDEFEMDFRVGGAEVLRYRLDASTPLPGVPIAHDGTIEDIVPNRRIVAASRMALRDRTISASLVTIELLPNDSGTGLILTHQGAYFEGGLSPQMLEAGWRGLLDALAAELDREQG